MAPPSAQQADDDVCASCLTAHVSDDLLHAVATRLDPVELVALCLADHKLESLTALRRRATQLARSQLRIRLRRVRQHIKYRETYVAHTCRLVSLQPLADVLAEIEGSLARSPDAIRDLSSATQKALSSVNGQSLVAPAYVQRVHADLLNVATFVCLFAWRLHLRSRREQQRPSVEVVAQAQPAVDGGISATPGAQRGGSPILGAAGGNADSGPQASSSSSSSSHHHLQLQHMRNERSTQTDLGSSLGEVGELLDGLRSVATAANPSMRACRASLNLLSHFLHLELLGWNPLVMPLI